MEFVEAAKILLVEHKGVVAYDGFVLIDREMFDQLKEKAKQSGTDLSAEHNVNKSMLETEIDSFPTLRCE